MYGSTCGMYYLYYVLWQYYLGETSILLGGISSQVSKSVGSNDFLLKGKLRENQKLEGRQPPRRWIPLTFEIFSVIAILLFGESAFSYVF